MSLPDTSIRQLLAAGESYGTARPPLSVIGRGMLKTPDTALQPTHDDAPATQPTVKVSEDRNFATNGDVSRKGPDSKLKL